MFSKRRADIKPAFVIPTPRASGKYDAALRYIERMLGKRFSNMDAEVIIALIDKEVGYPHQK